MSDQLDHLEQEVANETHQPVTVEETFTPEVAPEPPVEASPTPEPAAPADHEMTPPVETPTAPVV